MKEHNQLVKFKNRFIADPEKQEKLTNILSEDLPEVLREKMTAVVEIYRNSAAENGYSQELAYRVIVLNLLYSSNAAFDMKEEVERFFKNCLQSQEFEKLQLCFDLLLIKEISKALPSETIRILKIRLLRAMRGYYQRSGKRKDKRKCGYTLEESCKQALGKEEIKRNSELYCEVLDTLIEEVKLKVSGAIKRKSRVQALEKLTAFTNILEKSEQIASKRYQLELLQAYWSLAVLHHQLHYLAYTRKYAAIALNIAERTQSHSQANQIKQLLSQLT